MNSEISFELIRFMEIKPDNGKLVIVSELWPKVRIERELFGTYNPKRQEHLAKKPTKKN